MRHPFIHARTTLRRVTGLIAFALGALIPACQPPAPPPAPASPKVETPALVRPFVFGEVRTLHSKVLGQDRVLNILLPDGYSPDSSMAYPVVYMLDGSANEDFVHVASLAQFMATYGMMPKAIVVGIANVDRKHDFTHPTMNDSDKVWVPNSGGSAAFIEFIGDEVEPFITNTYRTNGSRTLIGQSLGGLLGTEILFTRPELFDNFILVSPSLWWDGGSLARKADGWAREHATMSKNVYIAVANNDDMMKKEIDMVRTALKSHAQQPLRWAYVSFPEETHATILHLAVYRAFQWMGGK